MLHELSSTLSADEGDVMNFVNVFRRNQIFMEHNKKNNNKKRDISNNNGECRETRLLDAPLGIDLEICSIEAGFGKLSRLSELGMIPGEKIRIIKKIGRHLVIESRNIRYGITPGLAKKIIVKFFNHK